MLPVGYFYGSRPDPPIHSDRCLDSLRSLDDKAPVDLPDVLPSNKKKTADINLLSIVSLNSLVTCRECDA